MDAKFVGEAVRLTLTDGEIADLLYAGRRSLDKDEGLITRMHNTGGRGLEIIRENPKGPEPQPKIEAVGALEIEYGQGKGKDAKVFIDGFNIAEYVSDVVPEVSHVTLGESRSLGRWRVSLERVAG